MDGVGDAALFARVDIERGFVHAQWRENALIEQGVERLAGCHFDDRAEHVGRARVVPLRARLEAKRQGREILCEF